MMMLELETSSSNHDSASDDDNGSLAAGVLTPREKRDIQKARLRPLAHRRPELYGSLTTGRPA